MESDNLNKKLNEVLERLELLENKVSELEKHKEKAVVYSEKTKEEEQANYFFKRKEKKEKQGEALEDKFGKFGLAWTGNIVLLFGITFITQYILSEGQAVLSSIVGFVSVGVLFGVSFYVKKSLPYISLMILTTGVLLLYYFTARLHFFSEAPLISSKWVCLSLLIALNGSHYFLSVKMKSKMFGVIALFLTTATAVMSDSTHFLLSTITLTAVVSVYLVFNYKWRALTILSILLVYFTFTMWLMGNPFMGNKLKVVIEHQHSIFYLFAIGSAYTLLALLPKVEKFANDFVISAVILNGLGFSLLVLLYVLSFFPANFTWVFIVVFVFCFGAAITLKFKSQWRFAPPFYALYSFVVLSVAVYGYYKLPDSFLMLSIESLLVVSMALWFRSKFIVIMNGVLFIFLLATYLSMKNTTVPINFAFAITAFVTARVLNWKKERLEIETEMLRNTYLVAAFVMLLYALYEAVPDDFITLSWTGAALLYYVLSKVLNNVKYRWMAIFTFIMTAIYLLFVDLERVNMAIRIVAFMALAVISIAISIIYSKKSKTQNQDNEES